MIQIGYLLLVSKNIESYKGIDRSFSLYGDERKYALDKNIIKYINFLNENMMMEEEVFFSNVELFVYILERYTEFELIYFTKNELNQLFNTNTFLYGYDLTSGIYSFVKNCVIDKEISQKLNSYGLFNNYDDAHNYMKKVEEWIMYSGHPDKLYNISINKVYLIPLESLGRV